MASYSYYVLHASLQYRSITNGRGFLLTQMHHDLVIPGLPEISSNKPKSFISNIDSRVEVEPYSSTYASSDPNVMVIAVEVTIVTEDDRTVMSKIREKMSVLNRILAVESSDRTKIGYSLEFDSGLSISAFEQFDFDEIIAGNEIITGKFCKKIETTLKKVAI